ADPPGGAWTSLVAAHASPCAWDPEVEGEALEVHEVGRLVGAEGGPGHEARRTVLRRRPRQRFLGVPLGRRLGEGRLWLGSAPWLWGPGRLGWRRYPGWLGWRRLRRGGRVAVVLEHDARQQSAAHHHGEGHRDADREDGERAAVVRRRDDGGRELGRR